MPDYSTIRTQFVTDRLRATRWEDREYIQQLMGIERVVLCGLPQDGAAKLLYERLMRKYPIEHGAIVMELRRGETTSDSQFRLLLEAQQVLRRRQEQLSRDEEEQAGTRQGERLENEMRQWLLMGGLE